MIEEKGKKCKRFTCKAAIREDVKIGDKVILLEFGGGAAWVYKARGKARNLSCCDGTD